MPQSLSNVLVHLVFSTKDRSAFLTEDVRSGLIPYIVGTLRNHDCECVQAGGVEDHVHDLFRLLRTLSIADVVQKVKTGTSKWMKSRNAEFSWQSGYGAFSVSEGESPTVVNYIKNQQRHHGAVSFKDE